MNGNTLYRPRVRRWNPACWLLGIFAALLIFGLLPGTASAHASLVRAVPEPNTQLGESPERIELTFNERLEDTLYSIKLVDEIGRTVSTGKTVMSADHTGISLTLPKLSNGRYVVSYHVISDDGHPIGESYVLVVGRGEPAPSTSGLTHEHTVSLKMKPAEYFQYAGRIAYYVTLLALIGWIAWYRILGIGSGHALSDRWRGWTLAWQRAFLLSLIFLIYTHFRELLGDEGAAGLLPLFTQTKIGLSWILSLLLSVIGFGLLLRNRTLDIVWIVLMLAVKSINGHAAANDPVALLLVLDAVHVLAASLWVAGLWMILVFWKEKSFLKDAVPRFSKMAFLSLGVLAVTGFATTYAFLPRLDYVWFTQWGNLLLVKTGAVVLVVLLAAIIRLVMKRRGVVSRLVYADFGLMVAVTVIVGMLTYVAPVPANQPLLWHEMGETVHMTTKVTPNSPGDNVFTVKVWLPESLGKPKSVELWVLSEDRSDVAPIQVPIQPFDDPEVDESYGFVRFSYKAEGPFIAFPGLWTLQVRVMDANDDPTVYEKSMRLY